MLSKENYRIYGYTGRMGIIKRIADFPAGTIRDGGIRIFNYCKSGHGRKRSCREVVLNFLKDQAITEQEEIVNGTEYIVFYYRPKNKLIKVDNYMLQAEEADRIAIEEFVKTLRRK